MVACVALDALLTVSVTRGLATAGPSAAAVVGVAVLAYLATDLVAGLVHFVADSFGTVHTPWLGRTFILPFRSHHERPWEICHHDFVETNGNNAFAALFALVPTLLWVPVHAGGRATLVGVFVLVFTVSVLLTNQIHKWAHVPSPPRIVRLFQRVGVFLSPEQHLAHHRPPHGRGYCVTSGLFNYVFDPIGFFPWTERVVRGLLGLRPRSE